MSDEQELKLACLHQAGGNLDHAKSLFDWVSGSVRATPASEAPAVSAPNQDEPEQPFNYQHPSKYGTDVPRRCYLEELTPEERAIRDLVGAIEHLGAHPLLTATVIQLMKAGESLADWVDIGLRDKAIAALTPEPVNEGLLDHGERSTAEPHSQESAEVEEQVVIRVLSNSEEEMPNSSEAERPSEPETPTDQARVDQTIINSPNQEGEEGLLDEESPSGDDEVRNQAEEHDGWLPTNGVQPVADDVRVFVRMADGRAYEKVANPAKIIIWDIIEGNVNCITHYKVAHHASDCALHNGPAFKPGPCDCGVHPGLTPEEYGSESESSTDQVRTAESETLPADDRADLLNPDASVFFNGMEREREQKSLRTQISESVSKLFPKKEPADAL